MQLWAAQLRGNRIGSILYVGGSLFPQAVDFYLLQQHYFKAHAYRVKPLSKKGHFTVDGEEFPFDEFQVEVHRGLGTLLSPYGYYAATFQPRPASSLKDATQGN